MAVSLRELITKIGFDVDEAGAKKAEQRVKSMGKAMMIGVGAIVAAVGAIGLKSIQSAGDMEMLATQFEVMLGSAEKANAMMEELKTFAASTPFALNDLASGSQQLLAFGIAEENVIDNMRMLGDAAGGNAEKLNGLVLAYGKVQAKGKAQTEELNMLTERGVPILGTLAEKYGVTKQAVLDMASQSKISADDITEAFETMTSEGGMFFEGMKKQSETFQGMMSTLKDNVTMVLAGIGEVLLPPIKEAMAEVTTLLQGALGEGLKNMVLPIFDIILSLLPVLMELLIPIMKIIGDIAAMVTPILKKVIAIAMRLLPIIMKIFKSLMPILESAFKIIDSVLPLLDTIIDIVEALLPIILLVVDAVMLLLPIIEWIVKVVADVVNWVLQLVSSAEKLSFWFNVILGPMGAMLNIILSIREHWGYIVDSFTNGGFLKGIFAIGKAILDSLLSPIQGLLELISMIPGLGNIADGLVDKVQTFRDNLFEQEGAALSGNTENMNTPSMSDAFNPAITSAGKTANIDMQNNITVAVPPGSNTEAIKGAVEAAARAVFTVELQKLIVDTGI